MTNGRDSDRPAIPGLGAANPTPPKDDRDYEELCKDILRDLSNAGVTFSHFHANNHNNFYSDDDLRYLWSLWNEVGLPVSRQERIFYKALFSQNEIGPAAILAGITAGQQTLAGSSVVGAAASTHGQQLGEAHPSSILGPTTSTRSEPSSQPIVGSSVPRGALSNQSYRPAEPAAGSSAFPAAASLRESRPTPSAIGSVTAESAEAIRHEPPVPSASSAANGSTAENSRAAYLAKLQAARRPTATSNVPLSSHTETSVTTSPTTILTTSQAPNVSKASDSTINALIKQKLEAARMSAQQASALQSQTPQSQDAKRNAFVPASMIKVDVEPPLPTQIQPSPTLQHSPPSAPIRPATSTSNPQTPTTPIPGLFMSVPQPPSGNSYFYPRPPTIDHAQNGRPIATSARSESTLSVNFSAGQTWTPVHQERVVINLNETDDEGGDEMDLEVDEPIREVDQLTAETASDVVSRPLRQYNSDADSVAARGETRVREEQREQIATQLYQFASQTDLEKKLADMKAKLKAERAMKAALSAQLEVTSTPDLSAIKSRAPTVTTTIAPTQPSTTVFDVSAPVAQPSNNGLPAASVTSTLTETVVTAASSQQKKRPSEDPDASGEWRKKRRAEIQSDLQTRDQDLGSTAAKIAEVERQLALLHEEQQRQQEARAQLAMELEELGVDTEGMSHEEMQATKDDIEAAQQVVETADVRDVSMEDSHTQLAIITAEKAQEQDVSREISRPQSAGPIAETATSLVQAADDVAPHSASATAETSANSIPPAEEAAPRASPTSPNTLRQALQALGQGKNAFSELCRGMAGHYANREYSGEPSTTSVPENAANGSPSDEDAMSLDSTGENDAEVDIAMSTTNQETELSTSETDGPQPADASTQPAVAVPAAENPGAYEPEVPAISSTSASSAQLEAVPSIHDGRILASRLATNAANPETARESSPERLLLADDPEASPLPLGRPQPREYVPYESPLTMFKAYRFHPEYSQKVTRGFRSLTYSHKIDPKGNPFCETELSQGVCNDPTCEFQHFGKVGLTGMYHFHFLYEIVADNQ